jgi:hypothetical protein
VTDSKTATYLSSDVHETCAEVADEIGSQMRSTDWSKKEIKDGLKKLPAAIIQQIKDSHD